MPPDFDALLDTLNEGLNAIPHDDLETVVDESYTAFGGLGPDLSRLVTGGGALAAGARQNLGPLLTLIDQSKPILDAQADSSDAVQTWAAHLATISRQLQNNDGAVAGSAAPGRPSRRRGRQLSTGCGPPFPSSLANLASVAQVALTYQPGLEQLLVLVPQAAAAAQGITLANRDTIVALPRRLPELQPQPQPAAPVHHRIPAGPAAARRGARRLPGTAGR